MEETKPDHYWKVPFYWEAGCKPPPAEGRLRFRPLEADWLEHALADVLATSVDEADQAAVAELGRSGAARELLAIDSDTFEQRAGWWRVALAGDAPVGFVLPVLLRPGRHWRDGKPQGTIYYVGVLPERRGQGHGAELLAEATRIFIAAGCWRIFCDTSANNAAMQAAFRSAGYIQRDPWQRPLR